MDQALLVAAQHSPWNKEKLVGQKSPLKLKETWSIRIRLWLAAKRTRDLALFNLAIDSKLRGCYGRETTSSPSSLKNSSPAVPPVPAFDTRAYSVQD